MMQYQANCGLARGLERSKLCPFTRPESLRSAKQLRLHIVMAMAQQQLDNRILGSKSSVKAQALRSNAPKVNQFHQFGKLADWPISNWPLARNKGPHSTSWYLL